jgi:hypothetical protein
MAAHNFTDLIQHEGHNVVVVTYGDHRISEIPLNVAVECEDCGEVILDFDREDVDFSEKEN